MRRWSRPTLAVLVIALGSASLADAGRLALRKANRAKAPAAAAHDEAGRPIRAKPTRGLRLRKPAARPDADGGPAPTRGDPPARPADKPRLTYDRGKPKYQQFDDPNFFGEKDLDAAGVPAAAWKGREHLVDRLDAADQRFFSGELGRLEAARFINRGSRTDGDFRYAYGKGAFDAFKKADARLRRIPRGQLSDMLDLGLMMELSEVSLIPADAPIRDRLLFLLHKLEPGPGEAGVLRQAERRMLVDNPTDRELEILRGRGVKVRVLRRPGGRRIAVATLVAKDQVEARLTALLDETRAALRDPTSDGIRVAARFVQEFIVIHPFLDGNGRISRLMMDAILRDKGIVPPILADTSRDVTLTEDEFVAEIEKGVVRMATRLGASLPTRGADGGWAPPDEWELTEYSSASGLPSFAAEQFSQAGTSAPALAPASQKLVRVQGHRFALGTDGFAYDTAGRPHLVTPQGELEPLTQLGYFSMIRRIARRPDGAARLTALTRDTRELFTLLATMPEQADTVRVKSDVPAIAADNRFHLDLPELPRGELLDLYDLSTTSDDALFERGSTGSPSYVMSRWQQHDLELWHVQQGFARRNDAAGARAILDQRSALFQRARVHLGRRATELGLATADNPLGFDKAYQREQYALSPLSRASLEDHIARSGDDTLIVFRGDLPITRYTGVHPDNIPLRATARDAARKLGKTNRTFSLADDLQRVEGSNVNSGYQSFTSDLGLLASEHGFGGRSKSLSLNLSALPPRVRALVTRRLTVDQTVGISGLGDVVKLALGLHRRGPAGQVDVASLDAAQLDLVVGQLNYASAAEQQLIRQRIAELPAVETRPGLAAQLRRRLGYRSGRTLKFGDLVRPEVASELERLLVQRSSLITLRRSSDDGLEVTTYNRAHAMVVAKAAAIPGIDALGGGFNSEQEIHVLDRVWPNKLKGVWSWTRLDQAIGAAALGAPGQALAPTGPGGGNFDPLGVGESGFEPVDLGALDLDIPPGVGQAVPTDDGFGADWSPSAAAG